MAFLCRFPAPAIELTQVDSVRLDRDPTTSAYYPLSPDAMRAIDAIEYITDHLKQDEEYKMVSWWGWEKGLKNISTFYSTFESWEKHHQMSKTRLDNVWMSIWCYFWNKKKRAIPRPFIYNPKELRFSKPLMTLRNSKDVKQAKLLWIEAPKGTKDANRGKIIRRTVN